MAAVTETPKSLCKRGWIARLVSRWSRRNVGGPHGLSLLGVTALGVSALGLMACGSDVSGPAPTTTSNLFWSLAFQWPAVNLALTAPYDTAQLTAIPRTATGAVLTDAGTVQYTTTDSSIRLSPNGFVTARYATPGALIVAKLTVGGITLTDTAIVQVTETPPPAPLDSLSIQPRPGLSAPARILKQPHMFVDVLRLQILPFFATLTDGELICSVRGCSDFPLVVHFATSDSTVAGIDQTGAVTPRSVGRALLSISTLAYGVHKTDSLWFSVGWPGVAANNLVNINMDTTQHPFVPYRQFGDTSAPNFLNVGGQSGVQYNGPSGQLLEVTIPGLVHGVHFVGIPDTTQVKDTLDNNGFVFLQFDSAGTYALQYRLLSTGTSISQSFTIKNFP